MSPHFGPLPFGPGENRFGTTDFERGEEVFVELDGPKEAYFVRGVVAKHQRQPAGTECDAFGVLNASHPADVRIEAWSDEELRLWAGDCCEWCSVSWMIITFARPRADGLDQDSELDCALFRYASQAEIEEHRLSVPDSARAYCIVTNHGQGRDGPRFLVIADDVKVEIVHARPAD